MTQQSLSADRDALHGAELCAERAFAAFPVVQMAQPAVTLDAWQSAVDAVKARDGSVIAVLDGNETVHALSLAYVEAGEDGKTVLNVSQFVSVGYRNGAATSVLLEAIEAYGRQRGCACVRIGFCLSPNFRLVGKTSAQAVQVSQHGYEPVQVALVRSLAETATDGTSNSDGVAP